MSNDIKMPEAARICLFRDFIVPSDGHVDIMINGRSVGTFYVSTCDLLSVNLHKEERAEP